MKPKHWKKMGEASERLVKGDGDISGYSEKVQEAVVALYTSRGCSQIRDGELI